MENQHQFPMLSLKKAYTEEDIRKFYNRICNLADGSFNLVLEPKFDGVRINCCYKGNKFIRASTRGNRFFGEDITSLIKPLIPLTLTHNGFDCEIHGELFINRTDFDNLKTQIHYKKSQNMVAGWLKNQKQGAHFIKNYGILVCIDVFPKNQQLSTQQTFRWLAENGFLIPPFEVFKVVLSNKISSDIPSDIYRESIGDYNKYLFLSSSLLGEKKQIFLPVDGIVLKVNEFVLKQALGETTYCPKWAIALKINRPGVETIVQQIVFQVGRRGSITPVGIIEPVEISGSLIKRITLHNLNYLKAMDLRLGDFVVVTKAGGVIPQILKIVKKKRIQESAPLNIEKTLEEQNFQLINGKWQQTGFQEQLTQQIIYYSKKLNISKLGPVLIKQLIEDGSVGTAYDLYNLKFENLIHYNRVREKTAIEIVQNIQATRFCNFYDWLVACGIPNIGPRTAQVLCQHITNFEDFVCLSKSEQNLEEILGSFAASSFCNWFSENKAFIDCFKNFCFVFPSSKVSFLQVLGCQFVLTGKLTNISRKEAQKNIIRLGAIVQQTVTKKTHYLIVGKRPSKIKLEKAQVFKCILLYEEQFLDLIKKF